MVASSVVPMLSVYPPISIAMDITIVLMKVTKLIARQLHVPTTNFSVPMVDPVKRQNVLQNRNFVMENVIAKMELMKSLRVR